MAYNTYVIRSETSGKIYIGHTENLVARLKRHNKELPNKKSSFTSKNIGPWVLVYREEFETRDEAKKREKYLKSSRGRKFIKDKISKH